MGKIDLANPPNEMPDIVGPRPLNPILVRFRPDATKGSEHYVTRYFDGSSRAW